MCYYEVIDIRSGDCVGTIRSTSRRRACREARQVHTHFRIRRA